MSSADREMTIIRIMAATDGISVSDDAESVYERVIAPLLTAAARQAWDEGATAAAAFNRAYISAYKSDSPLPPTPTNPYLSAKGDK